MTNDLVNPFGKLALEHPSSSGDAHLTSGNRERWRREFNDSNLTDWVVSTGTGQSVVAGAGQMVITAGTTPNQTTTVMSTQTFSVPFKSAFVIQLSSKIANVEWYVELVADNGAGGPDETIVAAWRLAGSDSVTVTNARTEVRNGGTARKQSANLASNASQTAAAVYEITIESDEVWWHSRAADSSAGRASSWCSNTTAPSPLAMYHLRFRCVTGAVAPASSTTLTAYAVTAVDYTEFQMEITGGQGSATAGQGIPVTSTGTIATTLTSTSIASSATVGGSTPAKVISAASTNATSLKATAGRVYGYVFSNTTASFKWVKIYNNASAPTVGTDVPVAIIGVPPNGNVASQWTVPITMATGIAYAITGGSADTDATATAVGDVVGTIYWL